MLYWQVGHRLRTEVLGANRAGYGGRIVAAVAARLTAEFGRGFTDKNLRHMIRFAKAFPDREIVYALSRQLSWTQFRSLIYIFKKDSGEEGPLGLILCAGKSEKHVELLQLDRSGIRVATYLTELPSRRLLERKLREIRPRPGRAWKPGRRPGREGIAGPISAGIFTTNRRRRT